MFLLSLRPSTFLIHFSFVLYLSSFFLFPRSPHISSHTARLLASYLAQQGPFSISHCSYTHAISTVAHFAHSFQYTCCRFQHLPISGLQPSNGCAASSSVASPSLPPSTPLSRQVPCRCPFASYPWAYCAPEDPVCDTPAPSALLEIQPYPLAYTHSWSCGMTVHKPSKTTD